MSNELVKNDNINPYINNAGTELDNVRDQNAIADSETQRALAEVQAQVMMAVQFPREPAQCVDRMLNECQRKSFSEKAIFSYARGGTTIDGLTIRSLEMIARNWRNIKFGYRVLDRRGGVSYIQAYAYDLESNVPVLREFQVKHWRDTRKGGYMLKDERDIYELEANQAQRRVRSCIEALIPADVKEAVMEAVITTLHTNVDITTEGIKALMGVFSRFGVNKKMVEARIQRKLSAIEPAQAVSLKKIAISLKDGMSSAEDWFDMDLVDKKPAKKTTKKKEENKNSLSNFKEKNKSEVKEKNEDKTNKLTTCIKCGDTGFINKIDSDGVVVGAEQCDCVEERLL